MCWQASRSEDNYMDALGDDVASLLESELNALWRFALRLTADSDDAADLVQRTCLRALEQQHNYHHNPAGKFRSWLFRIEHRIWLNELRSRKIRNHSSLNASNSAVEFESGRLSPLGHDGPVDAMETTHYLSQVCEFVERLPEAQRLVLQLVSVEGFSYGEAAEVLDVPIGTIMSRLARARVTIGRFRLESALPMVSQKTNLI